MKNEQMQNLELWSNDEQSKEPMNYNDVKLNKLRMKMNKTMNGIPMMSHLRNK